MTSQQSVFISGAAAGIGRAIAERFAAGGWLVGRYDIDEAAVRAAGSGPAGRLDVTDPASWTRSLTEFHNAAGRLDVLVNNAGILTSGSFTGIPLARHHQIIDVNVNGLLSGCHLAFDHLRNTPGAQVINLCSASAFYGQPGLVSYAASKSAVASITEGLDLEWRTHGITVRDIQPSFVSTAMARAAGEAGALARLGVHLTPEDIAEAVWRTAHRRPGRVHIPVGPHARILGPATRLAPARLARAAAAFIARA
ncbi:SDR family oxidoreductase [Nocardia uniformis]|uniref:SDR family oxidoreductase n=1 Tax=Nocardia uniformis TaxID=53432 RepID=A0A849C2A1_9NOCA|nr:SDR family oxidoreductase [Nocardia uniformis]NNH72832.1 SDR family oxidoreductase [Nocardia uniformis]